MAKRNSAACGTPGNAEPTPHYKALQKTAAIRQERRRIEELNPAVYNPRKALQPGDEEYERLKVSIETFGYVDPIIINADGTVIGGHQRLKVLTDLGYTEADVAVVDLSKNDEKALNIALNKIAGEWDDEKLAAIFHDLQVEDYDVTATGFDENEVADLLAAAIREESFEDMMAQQGEFEEDEDYQEFLDKFKGKKTTDDCYTPQLVYDAVAKWVEAEYGVRPENMVRPFYPGGDYQNFKYKPDSVVVDNPPFSILSEICRFYQEREIPYFMFAPSLTLLGVRTAHKIAIGVTVTYENGANVNTSFVTNLDENEVRSAPDLYQAVKDANDANLAEQKKALPKYEYPNEVLTSSFVARLSKYGVDFRVRPESCQLISALDAQKEAGAGIYGSGYLISKKAAVERGAAEKTAEENAVAEKANAEKDTARCWKLSEKEKEIVSNLR